jgi:hypothetical protein
MKPWISALQFRARIVTIGKIHVVMRTIWSLGRQDALLKYDISFQRELIARHRVAATNREEIVVSPRGWTGNANPCEEKAGQPEAKGIA